MRWENKARIMKVCASMPWGGAIYRGLQKYFGRLRAAPMSRLPTLGEMAGWVLEYWNSYGEERRLEEKRFFEVGTGHIPIAPIGWFLCGAESVVTVDLHRRIEWGLTRQSLEWMVGHRDEVFEALRMAADEKIFSERFSLLTNYQHDPKAFFKRAGIEYLAPMDAAHTGLPDESIDCHFSITVLEHIPKEIIRDIFLEAKRILKPGGAAIHFVDLSDHFQHQDNSISRINFLKFSETEWQRIAGNEFAYCNRLRASQFLKIFDELGYTVERQETDLDEESISTLKEGEIDPMFANFGYDDIRSISLRVNLRT